MALPHQVFVYGTLKVGQPFHFLFEEKIAKGEVAFVTRGRTIERYPLVVATPFHMPFVLLRPGCGKHVEGEIYSIDDGTLEEMDKVENVPHLYSRTPMEIRAEDGTIHTPIVYTIENFHPELLEGEMYASYDYGRHTDKPVPFTLETCDYGDLRRAVKRQ